MTDDEAPTPIDLLAAFMVGGSRWGATAAKFQLDDARRMLAAPTPSRFLYVTRPRGGRKSTDAALCALVLLILSAPPGARLYVVAVDTDQAGLILDTIDALLRESPALNEHVSMTSRKVTARASGATLEVLAADGASAFGLRPWLMIVDEFAQWPSTANYRRLWEAIISSVSKVPDSRLWVLTTAGSPTSLAAKVLEHAKLSARWEASETAGPLPWLTDIDLGEQRALLTPSQFDRLHLNRWSSLDEALASPGDLAACVRHVGSLAFDPRFEYWVGLDVGLRNDRTAVVVAHRDGREIVVDAVRVLEGSRRKPVRLDDVEDLVFGLASAYRARVIADPWQAVGLLQRLDAQGVRADEFPFTASSVGRLAPPLALAIRDRTLALPDDQGLLDELSRVQLRETSTPGVVRIDHASGEHDDRAIALALVVLKLSGEVFDPRPARVVNARKVSVLPRVDPLRRDQGPRLMGIDGADRGRAPVRGGRRLVDRIGGRDAGT